MSNEEGSPVAEPTGSVTPTSEGASEAGSSRSGLGSGAGESAVTQQPVDWRTSIASDDIRESSFVSNIKADSMESALNSLAEQGFHAQKMIGGDKVPKPMENWTPEQKMQWNQEVLGTPSDLSAYEFSQSEDSILTFSDEFLQGYAETSQQNGTNPQDAATLLDSVQQYVSADMEQSLAEDKDRIEQGLAPLQQEWGDKWDINLDQTEGFIEQVMGQEFLDLLGENQEIANNPIFLKGMHKLSSKAMDDSLITGSEMNSMNMGTPAKAQQEAKNIMADSEYNDLISKNDKGQMLTGAERTKFESYNSRLNSLYKTMYPTK
jgi:hypothetical protein